MAMSVKREKYAAARTVGRSLLQLNELVAAYVGSYCFHRASTGLQVKSMLRQRETT